jgi:hypothetical protein
VPSGPAGRKLRPGTPAAVGDSEAVAAGGRAATLPQCSTARPAVQGPPASAPRPACRGPARLGRPRPRSTPGRERPLNLKTDRGQWRHYWRPVGPGRGGSEALDHELSSATPTPQSAAAVAATRLRHVWAAPQLSQASAGSSGGDGRQCRGTQGSTSHFSLMECVMAESSPPLPPAYKAV